MNPVPPCPCQRPASIIVGHGTGLVWYECLTCAGIRLHRTINQQLADLAAVGHPAASFFDRGLRHSYVQWSIAAGVPYQPLNH